MLVFINNVKTCSFLKSRETNFDDRYGIQEYRDLRKESGEKRESIYSRRSEKPLFNLNMQEPKSIGRKVRVLQENKSKEKNWTARLRSTLKPCMGESKL